MNSSFHFRRALAALALAALAGNSQADVITSINTTNTYNPIVLGISTGDLLQDSGTTVTNNITVNVAENNQWAAASTAAVLSDGSLNEIQQGWGATGGLVLSGGSITYTFNQAYNLTSVTATSGWSGRVDQNYTVSYSSNGINFTTLATVNESSNANSSMQSILTADSGFLAENVLAVRFTFNNPQQNGGVTYRELDVQGTGFSPTVTYNGNGSDGGAVPTDGSSPYTYGATVTTLGSGTMTRDGYTFQLWNTAADGSGTNYNPGDTFTIQDNTTLYARWLAFGSYSLTYNGNGNTGGSVPVDANSPYAGGSTVTVLGNTGSLSKTNYSFSGWNTAANGSGTAYNAGDTFTINALTTLYALWTQGPDYDWDNSAATGAWNVTDANWNGAAWSNSATNNAFFTTVGGNISLDPGIVAGAVNVGNSGINFASLSLLSGGLTASSLTVQGLGSNNGNYGANPTLSVDSAVAISGDAAVGRANLNLSGGTFTANRIISAPASADWGRLVVSGGIVTATNGVDGSVNTGATFALDLNGGELRTPSIRVADREVGPINDAWLTFNGGTLKAIGADNADFITTYGGGQNTFVASGGAIIDTNGLNIGIAVNLLDAGGGGLTKDGAGTLTLSGTYSYTGPTLVAAGTLALTTATLSDTAAVDIASTAVLNLPVGTTDTVADFLINGVSQGSGTWNSANTGGRITGGALYVAPTDPFLGWIDATWPTLSDKTPNGDPDNDGISNLVEYVLQGGDPSVSTTGILPTLDASGADFVFTYYRRAAATGTTQTFEYGNDLIGWTPLAIPGGSGVVVTPDTPSSGIDQVVITVPKGPNTKLFGRLQVTMP